MKVGGYAGQVLYIDLTSKAIRKEPLDMNMARKHLGGFGLNCKFAWDLLDPDVDPLSPENIIFMGMGPMLGTAAPAANKHSVMTKWPSTGTISPGTAGGDYEFRSVAHTWAQDPGSWRGRRRTARASATDRVQPSTRS